MFHFKSVSPELQLQELLIKLVKEILFSYMFLKFKEKNINLLYNSYPTHGSKTSVVSPYLNPEVTILDPPF